MKDEIIRMAREAGLCMANDEWPLMERFAALVAAAEREACAKAVQLHGGDDRFGPPVTIERLAAAIRARGQKAPTSAP